MSSLTPEERKELVTESQRLSRIILEQVDLISRSPALLSLKESLPPTLAQQGSFMPPSPQPEPSATPPPSPEVLPATHAETAAPPLDTDSASASTMAITMTDLENTYQDEHYHVPGPTYHDIHPSHLPPTPPPSSPPHIDHHPHYHARHNHHQHDDPGDLHPRTSTPHIITVLPSFLAQRRCARCTIRIVHMCQSPITSQGRTRPARALIRWGSIPYYTPSGSPAEFVYHTAERVEDLRPELVTRYEAETAKWEEQQRQRKGGQGQGQGGQAQDLDLSLGHKGVDGSSRPLTSTEATDALRDSWVVEQLVYWVKYLDEWKYYRDPYIFREEMFHGEKPEVKSPRCETCVDEE